MDRRESLKSLLVGGVAGGLILQGCKVEGTTDTADATDEIPGGGYGRVPEEIERDKRLHAEQFFTEHEMATITILCDIILPADDRSGSASDAGVPDFIEFIVKDMPPHQLPLRGGLMWLDHESNTRFEQTFAGSSASQRIEIVDDIAYPDEARPEMSQGVKFFSLMRDLTMTGFYTTRIGIDDLGYKGNTPNNWDGVPDEVLKEQGLAYDEEWLDKFVDHSMDKTKLPEWDDDGNLIG